MKKYKVTLFVIVLITLLVGCTKKIDEISINDSPYDPAYTGPKVVQIDYVTTVNPTLTTRNNIIHFTRTDLHCDAVVLYRNGTAISSVTCSGMATSVVDNTAGIGVTYTYEVNLVFGSLHTAKSDAYTYTTP
jgi:hypothetical protein